MSKKKKKKKISKSLTKKILKEVATERLRQDTKWGEQNHDPFLWMNILLEEVGESSQAALQARYDNQPLERLREEIIQVAAVAVSIAECLERNKWNWPEERDIKHVN